MALIPQTTETTTCGLCSHSMRSAFSKTQSIDIY